MIEYEVIGYYYQPIAVKVKANTAGEAFDIGRDMLCEGQGRELEGAWEETFTVNDPDGDEVPEHELYQLGD